MVAGFNRKWGGAHECATKIWRKEARLLLETILTVTVAVVRLFITIDKKEQKKITVCFRWGAVKNHYKIVYKKKTGNSTAKLIRLAFCKSYFYRFNRKTSKHGDLKHNSILKTPSCFNESAKSAEMTILLRMELIVFLLNANESFWDNSPKYSASSIISFKL